ncbi:rhomboid family intramembrane serine protease [Pontibacillus yanchengensis]|uniref:Rhomboid family intramembrane serine protease n=2 Tax=Pontibacillus yanchengensis TaxID=462910 RepID=A0ACC7VK92_9BACI|nr:rhomboid family intramembrane serine protease [Pontibacillus yanchengensis]MYL36122.1 rhomboid family intramembrane serine protease [Pontibacillus yanchengensis]MYL55212.1 rhomboid family intramembrane serine protease [Pontibacillus yanchengensis]
MFFRTESFQQFTRSYPIITFLVGLHLFLWLMTDFLGLPIFTQLERTALGVNQYIAQGEYWRLVTPIFFHAGFTHALFNSFSLVLFGPALEQMLGKTKFIIAYLGAGIIGNVGTYFFGPDIYAHLGASGAIFGLFGIYLYMIYARKDLIDQANAQVVLTIAVIGVIMTVIRPGINVYGHMFGLLGGVLLAPIVLANARPYSPYRNTPTRKRYTDTDIGFDPNRWNKRRVPWRKFLPKLLWGGLIILVLLGLLGRIV